VAQVSDEQLREMAQHRGLKLVKSRRRKPGTGDFGKFGLSDAAGNSLFGIAEGGLTASAEDIQHYLRTSELGTWKQSADTTPDRSSSPKTPRIEPNNEETPGRRGARKRASSKRPVTSVPAKPAARPPMAEQVRRSTAQLRIFPKREPKLKPKPEPKPEPVLKIRAATPADSDELSRLFSQLGGPSVDPKDVADNLYKARNAKAGTLVAKLDEIVGCCGWAVIPTPHRGTLGRLTVLVVDKRFRRRGIATQMLAAAQKALEASGCHQLEAISDITINNSHNFFRSLDFEQTSYRFVRAIGG
jgi:ribosomal protein S18 acetylase RimI-like enzyme